MISLDYDGIVSIGMALFIFLLVLVDDCQQMMASPALKHMVTLEPVASAPLGPLTRLQVLALRSPVLVLSAFSVLGLHPPSSAGPRLSLVFRLRLFQFGGEQTSYLLLHRLCSRVTFAPVSVVVSIAYVHLLTVTSGSGLDNLL